MQVLLPWINSNQVCLAAARLPTENLFAYPADCGHVFARTNFNYGQGHAFISLEPYLETVYLHLRAVTNPVKIIKHQDVGADHRPAVRTARDFRFVQILVNLNFAQWCVINIPALIALKVKDTSMAFCNPLRLESTLKKVIVNVTCKHEVVQIHFLRKRQQEFVSFVGLRILV